MNKQLDLQNKTKLFSRGRPRYLGGSPNPIGKNQHTGSIRPQQSVSKSAILTRLKNGNRSTR